MVVSPLWSLSFIWTHIRDRERSILDILFFGATVSTHAWALANSTVSAGCSVFLISNELAIQIQNVLSTYKPISVILALLVMVLLV